MQGTHRSFVHGLAERLRLPAGHGLEPQVFARRHRMLRVLLAGHVPALFAFGLWRGYDAEHLALELTPVVAAICADRLSRRQQWQSLWVTGGLAWCSATFVHLAAGQVEAHFHFFIVVGFIALYQRWEPFIWSILFTVFSHGVGSQVSPALMFNHPAAIQRPWLWAAIHGSAVLTAACAQVIFWRAAEDEQRRVKELAEELSDAARHSASQQARFASLVENAMDGVAILDDQGRIQWASPATLRISGLPEDAHVGRPLTELLHPEDHPRIAERFLACVAGDGDTTADVVRIDRGGGWVWLEYSLVNRLDDEAIGGVVANLRDVTDRRQAEQELAWQASHDALTGLPNRPRLMQLLTEAATSADGSTATVGVMFLDLDRFKLVNDSLGHHVGDLLLVAVADRLRAAVRGDDVVARLGGDEFVVLCRGVTTEREVVRLAARVADDLAAPFELQGQEVFVTASIGIALYGPDASSPDDVLRDADAAMYRAKEGGRARFELFTHEMRHAAQARLAMETALHRALAGDELELHYQPIVSLVDGSLHGVEALLRWHHPDQGVLTPRAFLTIAEDTGLIVPLGEWVLERACRDLAAIDPAGRTTVAVNVSGAQLRRPGFVTAVRSALDAAGLTPERLSLELTEAVLVHGDAAVRAAIDQVMRLGVRLTMDDFGTGYSALTNLKRYEFATVKVDREFIARLDTDGDDAAIVEAVIGMAHALGMKVVAEGVETDEQAGAVRRLGGDFGQGHRLGSPVPIAEIAPRFLQVAAG